MLKRLYDWTMALAAHRRALPALGLIAFIESSVFPIPPDVMVVPMVLAERRRAWLIALVCTVASVLGGLAGYGIGFFLYETLGRGILEFYGQLEAFGRLQGRYQEWGLWIVFAAGLTPLPYKVFTIFSGVAGLDVWVFLLASLISRGLRFHVEAWLLWWLGEPIRTFIERYLNILAVVFVVVLIGGFVAIKYLL